MNTRRRLAGAAILAALLALPVVPASAATPNAHGYWWRLQTGNGPPIPAPPIVPPGGLWVASDGSNGQDDSSGQQAVSAVRYRAPSGVEIRRLVLRVFSRSGQGAAVLACPAGTGWKPAEAGEWSARPEPRCDIAFVNGVASSDGTSWSFDVRGLARSGTLDVVILPPPDVHSTFSIAFTQPDSSSVVTQRLPGSPSPTSPGDSPNPRRATPTTRVLASETTPPSISPSTSLPGFSPTLPSGTAPPGLEASGPIEESGTKRGLVIGVAASLAALALLGLAARALFSRSASGSRPGV